jgi:dihydroxyacetone kinase phosphotransfer subunit
VVGLVLVSHSAKLAEGLAELIAQMQPDVPVRAAGGMPDGRLGTSADVIGAAINAVDSAEGVLILLDLGSAAMSTEVALELLSPEQRARVIVSDAPLVEGAVVAAMQAALGFSLAEVARSVEEARHFPKNVAPALSGRGE